MVIELSFNLRLWFPGPSQQSSPSSLIPHTRAKACDDAYSQSTCFEIKTQFILNIVTIYGMIYDILNIKDCYRLQRQTYFQLSFLYALFFRQKRLTGTSLYSKATVTLLLNPQPGSTAGPREGPGSPGYAGSPAAQPSTFAIPFGTHRGHKNAL